MPINLLYHDVTPHGDDDSSGFAGPGAARYKLTPEDFSRHLDRIASVIHTAPVADAAGWNASPSQWSLTFDDGGVSAATFIAEALEQHRWRGGFFIATDFIGTSGFCNRDQIRDLFARGHVIGSHSCSHPERISSCSSDQLLYEWSRSCDLLADIVGQSVTTASVPGGFYSTNVARAAARAGIRTLFTSEPTVDEFQVEGCRIVGRYNIYRGMPPDDAAALLTSPLRRWRQAAFWNVKKIAKRFAGPIYKHLRQRLLSRAYQGCSSHRIEERSAAIRPRPNR